MDVTLRAFTPGDEAFWLALDGYVTPSALAQKGREGTARVLLEDGEPAGVLRWGLFWDEYPFLNMLHLLPARQRRGLGRRAMDLWEDEMRRQGHPFVMTSTMEDETAIDFYQKCGYRTIGRLDFGLPALQTAGELVLLKEL